MTIQNQLNPLRLLICSNAFSRTWQAEPIIVIGMHRSGTTMLSRIFHSIGVYMGRRLSENAESRFFQTLNREILDGIGGDWVNIKPATEKIQLAEINQQLAYELKEKLLVQGKLGGFFSVRHCLKLLFSQNSIHWGWKDPRNSITLPIWLNIFPDAKIVHIIRNGVDVAVSLYHREKNRQQTDKDYDPRLQDFSYCFNLWEQYVSTCRGYSLSVPAEQYIEMRYEDVLQEPIKEINLLMSCLNLRISHEKLLTATAMINPDRLNNTTLRQKYETKVHNLPASSLMVELKYS